MMKVIVFRVFFTLILVILQISFFDILFPWPQAPVFLLITVAAWTLVLGFPRSLYMTVPLTLVFDSVAYGAVSWFSLYAVLFAYGNSFLSRRLLIEHRALSLALYSLFAAGGVLMYQAITPLIFPSDLLFGLIKNVSLSPLPSWGVVFFSLFFSLFLFPPVYFVLQRFENNIERISQKQFLNVR